MVETGFVQKLMAGLKKTNLGPVKMLVEPVVVFEHSMMVRVGQAMDVSFVLIHLNSVEYSH